MTEKKFEEIKRKFYRTIAGNFEKQLIKQNKKKGELSIDMGNTKQNISYFLNRLKNGESINLDSLCKYAKMLDLDPMIFFEE